MLWNGVYVLIYVCIDLQFMLKVYAKRKDTNGYKTIYTCEGKVLNLQCDDGIVHLVRANYGRFSISICNDHGNLDWSVNCMSHESFLVMQDRCSFKPNCSINVSSNTFHDPCPGTLKYLEVQYHCGKDIPSVNIQPSSSSNHLKTILPLNTTASSSLPPAIPPVTYIPLRTTLMTVTEDIPVSVPWSEFFTTADSVSEKTSSKEDVLVKETLPSPSADYSNANYCAPTFSRGIHWTWTKPGETAVEKCPVGATGTARWHCLYNTAEWSPELSDLTACRSMWLDNLKERLEIGESIISVVSELAMKSIEKPLFSADLQTISDMIKQALYKSANSMENFLDTWHRYRVLRELLQSFVQIVNNLLEREESSAWSDLSSEDQKGIISSLLHGLDESALLLSEISNDDGSFSLVKKNVLLSLQILNVKTLKSFHFPMQNEIALDDIGAEWLNMQDSLLLPRQAVKNYASNGLYKIVFTAFNKLNNFLTPSSHFPHQSDDPSLSSNVTRIINSKIIGASLERGRYPKLHQPAVITLKHLIVENVTNPMCVYWDFHFRDWSTQGCWVQTSNRTHTVCFCEHLTNFAVVMDLQPEIVVPKDLNTFHIIIAIGCSIAIFSLLITIVIMFTFSLDMPNDSLFIHRNMFLCLLLSEILLLGGIRQTGLPVMCAIVASCLQYLLLATFFWMLLECYHQYATLARSCDIKKRNTCWYYAAAYIVPGLVTGISAAISPSSYGDDEYCWLQANYFIFSFAAPAAIIILGGFIFIVLAVCMLSQNGTIIQEKDSVALIKHRSWNRRSLFLIILSCSTWTMGFVFLSQESLFLAYTFSVLNSAHGVAVLILYCYSYEKISRDLRNVFSSIFWRKRKEQEPQFLEQSVIQTNDNLPSGNERFCSLKENKLFEKPAMQGCIRENPSSGDGTLKYSRGTIPRSARPNMNWNYGSRNTLEKEAINLYSGKRSLHNFETSPESGGQFFEHIYEAIDEQTAETVTQPSVNSRGFSPPENYYGDHSDISQHSSSSSSYNHQNQGQGTRQGQNTFATPYSLIRRSSQDESQECEYTWEKYKDSVRDKDVSEINNAPSISTTPNGNTQQSSVSSVHWQKNATKNWEPQLPNILQSPTENSVVLAVLEGDKVVSRIQHDEALNKQQYKLSTYY